MLQIPEQQKEEEITLENWGTSLDQTEGKKRINVAVFGLPGTGKTNFCLTAPEPICIIDTEVGVSLLKDQFPNKKIIVEVITPTSVRDGYEQTLRKVEELLPLIQKGLIGTVVLDSITDIWEFAQDYTKDKVWNLKPEDKLKQQWDWGTIYKMYNKIIKRLLTADCNVILTGKAGEKYAGAGKPLGTYAGKWMKDTPYAMDYVLEMRRIVENNTVSFIAYIEKSRVRGKELIGKKIDNPSWDKLAELLRQKG